MKTGVYFCTCGANIADRVDGARIAAELGQADRVGYYKTFDFLCSPDGKDFLEKDVRENRPDRVVIAACSPREHEGTFMRVLAKAGLNPYLMQMVNAREQIAWVTESREQATGKTIRCILAAAGRVAWHEPLAARELDVCTDVLIIGAGPAGLKAALTLAQAGRKVVLVEKTPAIGGLPVRFEEIFPNMECGPCLLEPVQDELLHGEYAVNIEILPLGEVVDVAGYYGNFTVKIRQEPRFVDPDLCVGCGECVEACPATARNEFNCGLDERKAMAIPFPGALPYAPFLDYGACLRSGGEDCRHCQEACPVEDAVHLDDRERTIQVQAGAIVVATGAGLYDCSRIPQLGYGQFPDIYTSLEFERMAASNGLGGIACTGGEPPQSVALVHCVGSLDGDHRAYCSGVCCQSAFKFDHLLAHKLPGTKVYHFYKELAVPGKEGFFLLQEAKANPDALFIRYDRMGDLRVERRPDGNVLHYRDAAGQAGAAAVDMVILCPAVVPAEDAARLGGLLEMALDRWGFFEELQGRLDSAQSKVKGIYLAGACRSPMDIQGATSQGMAAAGYILSGLIPGQKLATQPINAQVDAERCSGCRVCALVCPFKAIAFDQEKRVSVVNDVLCQGCGTCVAACPSGAMRGNHFSNEAILAEIEGVLA